ncbi:MAG TPA: class I SAM-dependent methyltransferase [Acidobacteriaceae bacterium]|nr:class I SAM-dependent methyltransferase [Acidobacteriaceae bacterium]
MRTLVSQPGSTFRDPAGSLRIEGEEVLRTVYADYAREALSFLRSDLAKRWMREGRLIESTVLSADEGEALALQHPRVFFPSYPWEWTCGQWVAAGELTLDLCDQLLDEGWILKDATPLNVLFEGCRPVFIDVLSVERRDPESPLWLAYGQFARTFLLPLAACKYLGWPLAATLNRRDGYEPGELYPYLSFWQRWSKQLRSLVTLPSLLEKKTLSRGAPPKLRHIPEIATAVLRRKIRGIRKTLLALEPELRNSRWSDYPLDADHYSEDDRRKKRSFVSNAMVAIHPEYVLDIGANTGEYSRLAAKTGAKVVAWDNDLVSSEHNWIAAREQGLAIQPMVVDVARPTPAVGWRNGESASLLDRAYEQFDCVMLLGMVHHLLVVDQIPLGNIVALLARLTRRWALIEWVPKTDARFIDLCRGRDHLYMHLDEAFFRSSFAERFTVLDSERLQNGRTLYLFEKK